MHLRRTLNAPHPLVINASLKDGPLSPLPAASLPALNQALRWHCVVLSREKTKGAFARLCLHFKWHPHATACKLRKRAKQEMESRRSSQAAAPQLLCQQRELLIYGLREAPASRDVRKMSIWWRPGWDKGVKKPINQKLLWGDTMALNKEVKCALRRSAGNVKGAERWVTVIDWVYRQVINTYILTTALKSFAPWWQHQGMLLFVFVFFILMSANHLAN